MTLATVLSHLLKPKQKKVVHNYHFHLEGVGLITTRPDKDLKYTNTALLIRPGATDSCRLAQRLISFAATDAVDLWEELSVLRLSNGKLSPIDQEFLDNCDIWDYSNEKPLMLRQADDSVFA